MSPRTAYLFSLFVFGSAAFLRGVAEYLSEGEPVAFLAVGVGGLILAYVGYNVHRPDSYNGPEEWGPMVYLTMGASLLFVFATVWRYV